MASISLRIQGQKGLGKNTVISGDKSVFLHGAPYAFDCAGGAFSHSFYAMNDTELRAELKRTLTAVFGELYEFPLFAPSESSLASTSASPAGLTPKALDPSQCTACRLHIGRIKSVQARGPLQARIAFVGDIPSAEDNVQGKIFSDAAGDLLQKMILAMKLKYEDCFLANLVPCTPGAQALRIEEARSCGEKFLFPQLENIPFIVALGEQSAQLLAESEAKLSTLRGQIFQYGKGSKLFATHHPRDLLQAPEKKKQAWEDLQKVMQFL